MNQNLTTNYPVSHKRRFMVELIAALFILLFTYTALSKLQQISTFRWVLAKSPLLQNTSSLLAVSIPLAELLIVLLLFFPLTRTAGLYAAFSLMLIFTAYISYMLLFTPKLPCSCGGVLKHMSWKQHLLFNLLFTGLALAAILLQQKKSPPSLLYNNQAAHPASKGN